MAGQTLAAIKTQVLNLTTGIGCNTYILKDCYDIGGGVIVSIKYIKSTNTWYTRTAGGVEAPITMP